MADTGRWPNSYAGFEALPYIHSIAKGAQDGCDGVGILSRPEWLPPGEYDVWGSNWIETRARWIREVAPNLLSEPRQ